MSETGNDQAGLFGYRLPAPERASDAVPRVPIEMARAPRGHYPNAVCRTPEHPDELGAYGLIVEPPFCDGKRLSFWRDAGSSLAEVRWLPPITGGA